MHITTDRAAEEATMTVARGIASEHLHHRADLCSIFMDALSSVPPTVFDSGEPGAGVRTRKSGHITIDWKRVFARASMTSLNLVSDDALVLADAALALCARHATGPALALGAEEAAVLCAIWSYRNVDGQINIEAAFQVALQNFGLREMEGLDEDRFLPILGALGRLHIIGWSRDMITMPDSVELSYA
ncbi:hypothetical protein [Massilia cavernae]|uniref:Uncharacterized protein n=1 Tax=Massilia cavernae TaxID=2320864 RepID=A0A418X7Y8_9BURK|nr:hypothetical protein [Massilia cavernae]RJG08518.1 hypothetical protein D3872_23665 [Massilia cavernae]